MSRVINPDSAGKLRTQLSRAVVAAMRELIQQKEQDETTRDLAAFIGLALVEIENSVEVSVAAWEKRGYWVKADRFRLEWEWAGQLGRTIQKAVLEDDWGKVAQSLVRAGDKLRKISLPARNRIGAPWVGAWERLVDMQ